MNEPTNWSLLARYLSAECSREEEIEVKEWLARSAENEKMLKFMEGFWNTPEVQQQTSDVNALWAEVEARSGIANRLEASTSTKKIRWASLMHADNYRYLRIAVSFIVLITVGYALKTYIPSFQQPDLLTITVENGKREKLALHDGTQIVLDAGSTLHYPAEFTGETREVSLNGEGYFEVTSNVDKPFVVNANHATVRVLGTRFNVRAWQPDQRVTVAVAEGKVSLMAREGSTREAVVISGGQASSLITGGKPTVPVSVNVDGHLGWMQNEMRFQDASVQEILHQLERWYDIDFVISDSSNVEERLNIHLQGQSLDEILVLLSALTDLNFQRRGKQIELRFEGDRR
jgi:ferric-dicitrate binding protein FerR (iron transport regulator)